MLHLIAQTTTDLQTSPDGSSVGLAIFTGVWGLFWLVVLALSIVAMWRLFVKAGLAGWASIIPFYNMYLFLKIADRPGWWLILFLIPFVNFILSLIVGMDIARKFGYGDAFGLIVCGLLGIGYLIIGFGSAEYKGNAAPVGQGTAPTPTMPQV